VSSTLFSTINNPNLYGLVAYQYPGGSGPAVDTYLKEAQAAGVDPNGELTPNGYAGGLMFVAALKKCGPTCDGPGLAKSLESLSGFDGNGFFAGPLQISADSHDAFTVGNVAHWASGSLQVVSQVKGG
jgi:hypothetical protein